MGTSTTGHNRTHTHLATRTRAWGPWNTRARGWTGRVRHRPHCLVAATCSVRTLSCLSHAPIPHAPAASQRSYVTAITHAPPACISWSLQVHSLPLGNLLQDPLTAAHRSDGRSWSAIGVSLQLGEGPAALGLLLVLGMRALPTCGCRRGRRVLLLVGCHCPASEFLPRAASELGGLALLGCTGLVQLACATGRTGQVECHCSKLHSVCCTWRTHVGVPMQSIADQELDWAHGRLEVSVECRSVSDRERGLLTLGSSPPSRFGRGPSASRAIESLKARL